MDTIVIGMISRKGGCGKTTLARLITSAIVHGGKRVLVIDTDPNTAFSEWAERISQNGGSSPLFECQATHDIDTLRSMLDAAFEAEKYDFILIDTPGIGGDWADEVAMQSDILLTPMMVTKTDIQKSLETFEWFERLKERVDDPADLPIYRVVVTRYPSKLAKTPKMLLDDLTQAISPLPLGVTERQVYQDMDVDGLLGVKAAALLESANPLERGQARRYLDALAEAVEVFNEIISVRD